MAVEAIGEPIFDGYTTENDAQDFKCITEQPGCRPIVGRADFSPSKILSASTDFIQYLIAAFGRCKFSSFRFQVSQPS